VDTRLYAGLVVSPPHWAGRACPAPDMVVRVKTPHKIFFISCFVLKLAETNKVGIKFSKGR